MKPIIVQRDPWLEPYAAQIAGRMARAEQKQQVLTGGQPLKDFAAGHLFFGLHRTDRGWVFREWAPHATAIHLIGDFSSWKILPKYALHAIGNGCWEIELPEVAMVHGDLYKLLVEWPEGQGERLPSYANRVVQDDQTKLFCAQVWNPREPYVWSLPRFTPTFRHPLIYETHVGMATEALRVGTFNEFRDFLIPYIKEAGYNTIQLMAIQEHPYYGSFGYHVSNFFAVSSRFGTPDDLKALIDTAHENGLAVIMDLVHSHSVKNVNEGLNCFDGTPYQYFHEGDRRNHPAWDSLCFNYDKPEVLHFLLSNCRYWMEEYHFDGFRFDGVTSMLYLHHGLGVDFTDYSSYFNGSQDDDAATYLILANRLIHEVNPQAVTIAEEVSGMPGIATPIVQGGFGFDYRLAMGVPDYWIKLIKEQRDEDWQVGNIFYELCRKRDDERTIGYVESHDQALVGDKTVIFRLIDKEMYTHMRISDPNLTVDRGIALHKMIRLITLSTAGDGYLCFMGNEFGHPEWIDFPREGNDWSFQYARRQWSLVQNKQLKYKYLADFDRAMLHVVASRDDFFDARPEGLHENQEAHVLCYRRNNLIFVFNFNPSVSYTDYKIHVTPGKYKIVLQTDAPEFGGFGRIDDQRVYYTDSDSPDPKMQQYTLHLYLPARTAMVLESLHIPSLRDLDDKKND